MMLKVFLVSMLKRGRLRVRQDGEKSLNNLSLGCIALFVQVAYLSHLLL